MRSPTLPSDALARWRALAARREVVEHPLDRVRGWLERLAARMIRTGGRLSESPIATRLCDFGTLAECVRVQIDAGPVGNDQLLQDVRADLDVFACEASIEQLEAASEKIASFDAVPRHYEDFHGAPAARLLETGHEDARIEAALDRIAWHGPLLDWLEHHAGR